jgi:hypothetical protein
MKIFTCLAGSTIAVCGFALGAAPASADAASATAPPVSRCTGTLTAPGVLAGHYRGDVVVSGFCQVNGGAAVVDGDLVLAPGSALNATFALNDLAGKGTSSLLVRGSVEVLGGAILAMGCLPVHSPCSDDPNAGTGGTLTGDNRVNGSVSGSNALALIVHASEIRGSVTQVGGGGGTSCAIPASGVFKALGSPVFSDYEDNHIGGSLDVYRLTTCWFGAIRDDVRGSVQNVSNTFGDPDADEVHSNVIRGSLACYANTPAVQYGDAVDGVANRVRGSATGECGFNVDLPNPVPSGPLTPISVKV